MKAILLAWRHHDSSGWGVERVYLEKDFEQAEKDLSMLENHSDKKWSLIDVDFYGLKETFGKDKLCL